MQAIYQMIRAYFEENGSMLNIKTYRRE